MAKTYDEYEFKNECLIDIREEINMVREEPFNGWYMVQKLIEYYKIYNTIPTTYISNKTKYKYMIWYNYLIEELVLLKANYEDLNTMLWGLEDAYKNMEWYLKSKAKANLNKANEKYKSFKDAKNRVMAQLKNHAKEKEIQKERDDENGRNNE